MFKIVSFLYKSVIQNFLRRFAAQIFFAPPHPKTVPTALKEYFNDKNIDDISLVKSKEFLHQKEIVLIV